ncbi:MAG: hypothetical protein HRU12_22830 [Phaeodactylibacter sp.]|nr:hypothetical protein [Phaeodactylibacter sp.]
MISLATKTKATGTIRSVSLSNIHKELQLYQRECKLYYQLLRSMDVTMPQIETLRKHLRETSRTTLPKLQMALRSFEGQTANITTAEGGQSHMVDFLDQLQAVRAQVMALKHEVFDLMHQNPVKPRIW